jgi:hypothetical protein
MVIKNQQLNSFCDFLLRDFITIQGSLTMHKSQFLAYLKTNYEHRQHVRRFFILEDGCMVCWFMVFNATFNNKFQLYRGGQFYRRRKPEKTKSLLYRLSGIRIHNISGDRYCLQKVVVNQTE